MFADVFTSKVIIIDMLFLQIIFHSSLLALTIGISSSLRTKPISVTTITKHLIERSSYLRGGARVSFWLRMYSFWDMHVFVRVENYNRQSHLLIWEEKICDGFWFRKDSPLIEITRVHGKPGREWKMKTYQRKCLPLQVYKEEQEDIKEILNTLSG